MIGVFACTATGGSVTVGKTAIDLKKHTFVWKNKHAYIDDVDIGEDERELGATNYNLYLCSYKNDYFYSGKIYRVKIWKSGVLERDMIPCYRKNDYVAGLFDTVHEVFYTNSGTGAFSVGAPQGDFIPGKSIDYLTKK